MERKPHFSDVPSGPRPAPEGESMSLGSLSDGRPAPNLSVVKNETHIQVKNNYKEMRQSLYSVLRFFELFY